MGFNHQALSQVIRSIAALQFSRQFSGLSSRQSSRPARIKFGILTASAIALTTACGNAPSVTTSPTASPTVGTLPPPPSVIATSPNPNPATAQAEAAKNYTISATAIGAAQLGMTFGDLKKALGNQVEFKVESPYIVDFDAIAVRKDGQVLYRILYLAKQTFKDTDLIQGILTDNPKFRTAQNVGPGVSIADAEKAYGKATLSYNTQNESKEYARFERQPASNLAFSTGNGNQNAAGVYPSPTGEFNETKEYKEGAKINSVLLICASENCATAASPAVASPAPNVLPNAVPRVVPIPSATPTN